MKHSTAIRAPFAIMMLGLISIAHAHDARPLSITIVEQTDTVYRVVTRIPPTIETQNAPRVIWPGSCEPADGSASPGLTSRSVMIVNCSEGLENQRLAIDYPFFNPSITTLIRLQPVEGAPLTAVLPPDELEWNVPAEPTFASVARDYLKLGFRHIWEGIDHLLFVAGLLLLARRPKPIVWAITGFTLAHSITLSLSALNFVRLPTAPVEAMIALSILFLAAEIARDDATSFSRRFPIALSFVFGLLHGFGFASALGEIGLPRGELVAGLLFFNIGVELGQLAFIAAIAVIVLAARLLPSTNTRAISRSPLGLGLAGAYCLGIPAAYWFLERTSAAFAG